MLRQFKHLTQFLPKHKKIIDASDHRMPHMTYPKDVAQNLKAQYIKPQKLADWSAFLSVKLVKNTINLLSLYGIMPMTQKRWLIKTLMLETLSVVPGTVASMCRHMRSIRLFEKDNGWIQQLIQVADNERFHYFTILSLNRPGLIARTAMAIAQIMFFTQFLIGYTLSSRYGHRFVGYFQQEAFKHYTSLIKDIDRKDGPISHWKDKPASKEVIQYYKFDKGATLRDMFLMIRADQVSHNQMNHFMAQVNKNFDFNAQKQQMYLDKCQDIVKEKKEERKS